MVHRPGLVAKIGQACGFKHNEADKVKAEVIDRIGGQLSVGTALDAYIRLEPDEKADYSLLVKKLTEEFVDPLEARNFNENLRFNKRKVGQSLKDFEQAIKKDMKRYSTLPEKVRNAAGDADVDNPEYERQGVRRFRMGYRDREGKKDPAMKRHLMYNLMKEKSQTWKNLMEIAAAWELADYDGAADKEEAEEESSSSEEDDDELKAVEVVKSKKSKASKKGKSKCKGERDIIAAIQQTPFIATLSDKVQENQVKIKQIETTQERMSTQLKEVKDSVDMTNGSLQNIEAKLDAGFTQTGRNYQPNLVYKPNNNSYKPPQQQSRTQQFGQQNRGGNMRFQPRNFTWSANNQNQRQGNYGLQRKTPTNFNQPQTQQAPLLQRNPAPTAAAAAAPSSNPVAAMGESEIGAEALFTDDNGEDEMTVTLNLNEFMALTDRAGYKADDIELNAAVDNLNLQ